MTGVQLKLFDKTEADTASYNLRMQSNVKFTVDNISKVIAKIKMIKGEVQEHKNAIKEVQELI